MSRTLVPRIIKFSYKKHPLSNNSILQLNYSCSAFHTQSTPRERRSNTFHVSLVGQIERLSNEVRKSHLSMSAGPAGHKNSKSTSYDRNYITESRALNEYLLEPADLTGGDVP